MLDNILHTADEGDIHFNLYVPQSYDGSQSVALFVTLPGYQGLYFQGVGMNVCTEDFGFTARDYDQKMIVLAPQLSDWGETSARQTIALVTWMQLAYAIDQQRVYLEGYSGGETLSIVMGMKRVITAARRGRSAEDARLPEATAAIAPPLVALLGLLAFVKRETWRYLFGLAHFVPMDYTEPAWLYVVDYLLIGALFVFLGHLIGMAARKTSARGTERGRRIYSS